MYISVYVTLASALLTSDPKRHHYLPKCYLDSFATENELVSVYSKKRNTYIQQLTKDTAVESGFYSYTDADGGKNNDVEKLLGVVETSYPVILNKIVNFQDLTDDEQASLSMFLAFQWTRTPVFRKIFEDYSNTLLKTHVANLENNEQFIKEISESLSTNKSASARDEAKELLSMVKDGNISIQPTRSHHLVAMMELAPRIARMLLNLNWVYLHASKRIAFVTSDYPTIWAPTEQAFIFPMSSSILLMVQPEEASSKNFTLTDRAGARMLNIYLHERAIDITIARDIALLKRVASPVRK